MRRIAVFIRKFEKAGWRLAVLVLVLAVYVLGVRGLRWSRLHPDEHAIGRWIHFTQTNPYITERVYPGGFFELARPVSRLAGRSAHAQRRCNAWQEPGRVHEAQPFRVDHIVRARRWNAGLMALSALLLYGLACRLLKCRPAAWLAAAWLGLHPFIVEHAHYAETDAVMLAMQLLTLWLLVVALQRERVAPLLAAAAAAGVAFGCKYTLFPILLLPVVAAWTLACRQAWPWRKRAVAMLAVLVLVVAGFLWATPVVYRNFHFFRENGQHISRMTYGEIQGLLGEMRHVPAARWLYRARTFLNEAVKIGVWTWVLLLAAAPLWFSRCFRPVLPTLPLFAVLFVLHVAFVLPWFRNQEFLPLLPMLAVTLVLPIAWVLRDPVAVAGSRRLPVWRTGLLALYLAGFGMVWYGNLAEGIRISSAFGHADSRDRMRAWLNSCAPGAARVGYEPYTGTVAAGWNANRFQTPKVEGLRPEAYALLDLDYQVCTPSMRGRGLRHPWTRQRYARNEANYVAFTNRMAPLRGWTVSTGSRPIFSQIDLEIWGRRPPASPRFDVPLVLARPVLIGAGQDRFHAPLSDAGIGPWEGVRVVGRRHQLAVCPERGRPLHVVALLAEGHPASVLHWNHLFTPREAAVDPVAVFTLGAEVWSAARWNVLPTARVRLRRENPFVRCVALGTASAAEAALALRIGGGPEQALAFLDARAACEPLETAARVERFLAADACARRLAVRDPAPRPPRAEDAAAARLACEALDIALADAPDQAEAIFVNGTSLAHLADFSRIRFDTASLEPGRSAAGLPGSTGERFQIELPCLLPPGVYDATFIFSLQSITCSNGPACRDTHALPELALTGCTVESVAASRDGHDLQLSYRCRFRADAPVVPTLVLEAADGILRMSVLVKYAELTWAPLEQLQRRRDELAAALGRLEGAAVPD